MSKKASDFRAFSMFVYLGPFFLVQVLGKAVAEMSLKLWVASVLLLLLCSEVLSYNVKKRGAEDKTVLTQIKDAAEGYINYVTDVTNSWVEKVKSLDISQRVWNSYNNFVSTVDTYKNIITDQVVYFWHD